MSFFGVGGDRFRPSKEFTPGPGDYDPAKARGFKADPKSGFLTGDRFHELEREGKRSFKSRLCISVILCGQPLSCLAPTHWLTFFVPKGLYLRSLHQGKGKNHRQLMAVSSLGPLKGFMTWRKSWSRQRQRSRSVPSTCLLKSQCDV